MYIMSDLSVRETILHHNINKHFTSSKQSIFPTPNRLPVNSNFSSHYFKDNQQPTTIKMQFSILSTVALLAATISAVPTPDTASKSNPVVGTFDFWKTGGCTPKICNKDFAVKLNGCTVVPKGCSTSARLSGANENCECEFPFCLSW